MFIVNEWIHSFMKSHISHLHFELTLPLMEPTPPTPDLPPTPPPAVLSCLSELMSKKSRERFRENV